MSTDRRVTKDLIETLEDGKEGFARAADKLADSDRPELSGQMRAFSRSAGTLLRRTRADGGELRRRHRRERFRGRRDPSRLDGRQGRDRPGPTPKGVLDAAEQGEDHAVSEYTRRARQAGHLTRASAQVIERQFAEVQQAHDDSQGAPQRERLTVDAQRRID